MREDSLRNSGNDNIFWGRNSVLELLASGRDIDKIYVQKGAVEGSIKVIVGKASAKRIPIVETDRAKLDAMSGGAVHQGVAASVPETVYADIEDLFAQADKKGEKPFFVICDCINDPHNLGAIIRTAECAGAHGVIIPKHRSVSLTSTVAKSSAGAVFRLPVARVGNIASVISELQSRGVWVYALEASGTPYFGEKFDDSGIAFVLGSEGEGVSRIVKEKSDFVLSIPMYGELNSLNVSAAAAVMLFEAARQRHGKGE